MVLREVRRRQTHKVWNGRVFQWEGTVGAAAQGGIEVDLGDRPAELGGVAGLERAEGNSVMLRKEWVCSWAGSKAHKEELNSLWRVHWSWLKRISVLVWLLTCTQRGNRTGHQPSRQLGNDPSCGSSCICPFTIPYLWQELSHWLVQKPALCCVCYCSCHVDIQRTPKAL